MAARTSIITLLSLLVIVDYLTTKKIYQTCQTSHKNHRRYLQDVTIRNNMFDSCKSLSRVSNLLSFSNSRYMATTHGPMMCPSRARRLLGLVFAHLSH